MPINPDKFSTGRRAFTVLELMVIVALVALLMALLMPAMTNPVRPRPPPTCVNNLRQLGIACVVWKSDNRDLYPMQFYTNQDGTQAFADATNAFRNFQMLSNEINNPKVLVCPNDKQRTNANDWGTNMTGANFSYFIGLDADASKPTRLLSGDRNITNGLKPRNGILYVSTDPPPGWIPERHQGAGNLLLVDASVQHVNARRLRNILTGTGLATNRLALP